MEALVGLIGTVVGAAIAGAFVFLKDKQQHNFERAKEKKKLLLEKYELIYKELIIYQEFATDISMQMISEVGYSGKFNVNKIRKDIKDTNLKMNASFYAPQLSHVLEEIEQKHTIIARAMTEFILKFDAPKDEKGTLTGNATIALAEMTKLVSKAQVQLSSLALEQVNA
jgi:gas vesicle protein